MKDLGVEKRWETKRLQTKGIAGKILLEEDIKMEK